MFRGIGRKSKNHLEVLSLHHTEDTCSSWFKLRAVRVSVVPQERQSNSTVHGWPSSLWSIRRRRNVYLNDLPWQVRKLTNWVTALLGKGIGGLPTIGLIVLSAYGRELSRERPSGLLPGVLVFVLGCVQRGQAADLGEAAVCPKRNWAAGSGLGRKSNFTFVSSNIHPTSQVTFMECTTKRIGWLDEEGAGCCGQLPPDGDSSLAMYSLTWYLELNMPESTQNLKQIRHRGTSMSLRPWVPVSKLPATSLVTTRCMFFDEQYLMDVTVCVETEWFRWEWKKYDVFWCLSRSEEESERRFCSTMK